MAYSKREKNNEKNLALLFCHILIQPSINFLSFFPVLLQKDKRFERQKNLKKIPWLSIFSESL